MFVGDEVVLDVSFATAKARLMSLTEPGALLGTAQNAYDDGKAAATAKIGAAGVSKLVRVQARELTEGPESAGLAIRWDATGTGSGLFPVLDADLRLAPAGDGLTLLTLAGAYRPPMGSFGEFVDRTALHRVAAATIRNFLSRVATSITGHNGPAETANAGAGPSLPPVGPS
jgi:hypothetical protein